MWWIFHNNSNNKNRRIFLSIFLILFSQLRIFHESGIKTEGGGGICLSFLDTGPLNLNTFERNKNGHNSKTKNRKYLKFDFFYRFSRFRIIHVNLSTFENYIRKKNILFKNILTFLKKKKMWKKNCSNIEASLNFFFFQNFGFFFF